MRPLLQRCDKVVRSSFNNVSNPLPTVLQLAATRLARPATIDTLFAAIDKEGDNILEVKEITLVGGFDINGYKDYDGFKRTALYHAAGSNKVEVFEHLLKHSDIDVNRPSACFLWTPLHALHFLKRPSARFLWTPLHLKALTTASWTPQAERIFRKILEHPDVDVNACDKCGFTPLFLSVCPHQSDRRCFEVLLQDERTILSHRLPAQIDPEENMDATNGGTIKDIIATAEPSTEDGGVHQDRLLFILNHYEKKAHGES